MAFDGLTMYKISNELKSHIVGGKIDKIFEPNSNEIILGVYNNSLKYALDIVTSSNNYRLCFTTNPKPNPTFAPNFCMVLRKYLLNTRITGLSTLSLERIVILEFEGHNKSGDFSPKRLIIELMGKHSNIILLNSDNIIIDALKHFDTNTNSYRNILPGYQYYFPISNKLDFMEVSDFKTFYENLSNKYSEVENTSDISLSSLISNTYIGLSKNSILYYLKDIQVEDVFNKENTEKIYLYIKKLIENKVICVLDNSDYYLRLYEIEKELSPLALNFFIDDYYSKKENSEEYLNYINQFSKLLLQHLKKLNTKLSNINKKLNECQNTDLYKLYGELITSNLYKLGINHTESISLENYYDNNKIITIPLDKSLTPNENAKKYFKKYHKLKNAKLIVETQKSEVEQEIDYLESIVYALQSAITIEDIDEIYHEFSENFEGNSKNLKSKDKKKKKINRKEKKKAYIIGEPIKYTLDNFQVIVGKNNTQNDYITKNALPDDLWFHTKDIHGSHVILKTNQKTPSQDLINRCAAIAAYHSKAKQSDNVSVDYTYAKYVKKPSKSKPGMVIYTNYKTVIVKPNLNIKNI